MSKLQLKTTGALLIILCVPCVAIAQQPDSSSWAIVASVGQVTSNLTADDVTNYLSNNGITATEVIVDSDRVGYSLNLAYKLTNSFAVVAGYTNLNEVSVEIAADVTDPDEFVQLVKNIHPVSGDGFTLGVEYSFELSDKFRINTQVGAFAWQGDFNSSELLNGEVSASNEVSGTDLYYGVSAEYNITKPLAIAVGWQRFNLDDDESDMWSIGIKYSL